jgi:hypothetical protein
MQAGDAQNHGGHLRQLRWAEKSQFIALLSITFYTTVVLIYLIPRHSHNIADLIVAWCRNAMKGKNFYTPMAIVKAVN